MESFVFSVIFSVLSPVLLHTPAVSELNSPVTLTEHGRNIPIHTHYLDQAGADSFHFLAKDGQAFGGTLPNYRRRHRGTGVLSQLANGFDREHWRYPCQALAKPCQINRLLGCQPLDRASANFRRTSGWIQFPGLVKVPADRTGRPCRVVYRWWGGP